MGTRMAKLIWTPGMMENIYTHIVNNETVLKAGIVRKHLVIGLRIWESNCG
jgi:hypothetical protein